MSNPSLHFYDASEPRNVPTGVHAAIYINGLYTWPLLERARMGWIISISVLRDPAWARHARVIDVETGAARPEDVVPFIVRRKLEGYDDATAYVNRSNWPTVRALVENAGLTCRYWVATLDGTDLPGAWAVQIQGGARAPYDLSILHGTDDFHRP